MTVELLNKVGGGYTLVDGFITKVRLAKKTKGDDIEQLIKVAYNAISDKHPSLVSEKRTYTVSTPSKLFLTKEEAVRELSE